MAISLQRVIRYVWFYGRVFGDGGSNGAIYGSNKSKMAATAILEKFQVAISLQPVVRATSCFVLGWDFGDAGSNGAIFDSNKFKMAVAAILDTFEWPYLRNGSRSTNIARGHLCDSTAFLFTTLLIIVNSEDKTAQPSLSHTAHHITASIANLQSIVHAQSMSASVFSSAKKLCGCQNLQVCDDKSAWTVFRILYYSISSTSKTLSIISR